MGSNDSMIHYLSDNVASFCGVYVWSKNYKFANPWHCLDEMVRHFAMNLYLNQTRNESVLLLPSYKMRGWRTNKYNLSKRINPTNYHYLSAIFKYFIPSQQPLSSTKKK